MNLRSAGRLIACALPALAACRPAAQGLCSVQSDCRDGSYCSLDGICVGASSDCSPQCSAAEVCNNHSCVPLKPQLTIKLQAGALLSPQLPQVTVHVEAAPGIALHALLVEAVDGSQRVVASGSAPGSPGDLTVTLGSFQPDVAASVSVTASLDYDPPSGSTQSALAPSVQAFLDDQPPSVTVFVPAAADAVGGWVPRTADNSEVRAQVDDGSGSGPDSATLSFDVCPAAVPCSYAGASLGSGTFSFQVPRTAQAAGVASRLALTVKAKDKAGNEGKARGGLQIDDSAPVIGGFALISTGATGLDGKTWFPGGSGAPAVEIAVPVSDTGVGVGTTSLQLEAADVAAGTTLDVPEVTPPPADGKAHFRLPASAVQGRAGHLRFSLKAADKLQHTTAIASSDATAIWVDAQPPAVGASIVVASDSVSGWVPRTSANIEVDATVDDGTGSGPASATLTLATCPSGAPCTYQGTGAAPANGVQVFSFLVPRMAQTAGSAAPMPATVTAKDKVGNAAAAQVTLQIDDSSPVIGNVSLVSAGTAGEDGKTWFIGGSGAPLVEIAVPASDTGVGLATLLLQLDQDDVVANTPLNIGGTVSTADGMIHFQLPAAAVQHREGHLRYTLTATDRLQHTTILGPSDSNALWIDDLPPTVSAPHVDYPSATPATSLVCGAGTVCGRGSPPDHLLRDDTAGVSFDVTDCGVGIGAAPTASATSGGTTTSLTVGSPMSTGTPCAASTNHTHHYTLSLNAAALAALDAPDASGTSLIHLTASGADQFSHSAQGAAASGATSGDGLALISLVRWRTQLNGLATGSAALVPVSGGGARQIAFGTDNGVSAGPNLVVLNADGSQAWSATLATPIHGDVAFLNGNLYLSGDTSFYIVPPPPAAVQQCAVSPAHLGASPALMTASGSDLAFAAATSRSNQVTNNVYSFELAANPANCNPGAALLSATGELTGVTAASGVLFFSHGAGFTSAPLNGKSINALSTAAFSGSAPAAAPPSISSGSVAIFGGLNPDQKTHSTTKVCTATCSWNDATGFPTNAVGTNLPLAEVFDGTSIYAADDQGKLYAWSQSSGSLLSGWPQNLGAPTSAPVILQGGSLLLLKNDGTVALAGGAVIIPLVKVGAPFSSQSPQAPAVDSRSVNGVSSGVAYVGDGKGVVSAVQLSAPPLAASGTAWPRPGRDSCNSRNSGSSCQ